MNIKFLIKNLVKAAGTAGIAEKMLINDKTLRNKIDPNQDTHHLYVEEIDSLVDALNTDAIANYFAEQRGLMCIKKPDFEALSDKEILDLFLDLQAQQGEWAREISKAMASGDIDWNELVSIRKEYNEFITAAAEVMNRLQSFMAVSEEMNSARAKNK
jgi:hypothetical protein